MIYIFNHVYFFLLIIIMNRNSNNNGPNWTPVNVSTTIIDATLLARIRIEDENTKASSGDQVAIYVGDELRTVADVIIASDSFLNANIKLRSSTETVTKIEIWDSSESKKLYASDINIQIEEGKATDPIIIIGKSDDEAPLITILGNSIIYHELGTTYDDEGATATDNISGDITDRIKISGLDTLDTSVSGTYKINYSVTDDANNSYSISRTVYVIKKPEIGDLQFKEFSGYNKNYEFSVTDHNPPNFNLINVQNFTIEVKGIPTWGEHENTGSVQKINLSPGLNNIGTYSIDVILNDNRWGEINKTLTFNITSNDFDRFGNRYVYNFIDNESVNISDAFDKNCVDSANLKFVENKSVTTYVSPDSYKSPQNRNSNLSSTANYVNVDVEDSLYDQEIEVELMVKFNPMFLTYKFSKLVEQVELSAMSSYNPSRWGKQEQSQMWKLKFQGFMRDFHFNNGCVQEDFDAGICEDPHILTFGGNRLDLPHDDNMYNMINGLDLKINVKSQLIGDGSFAKYFYVNYQNEEFVLDIDNLELKELTNKMDLKYHMLPNKDYDGIKFKFDKMKCTLIVKSTDGVMDLVFNSETRGLLIKSRLNFTQENSTGIMMSSYIEDSKLENLDQ